MSAPSALSSLFPPLRLSSAVAPAVVLAPTLGLSLPAVATAADEHPVEVVTEPVVDRAEYVRLQQELEKLAARNAWSGVERTYQKLVATGVEPTFDDHVAGAHAARALGDVGAARGRLAAANALKEDKQVVEWLWDIDSSYGRVFLACDASSKRPVELEAAAMPFHPDMRRAVEFATARIADACEFDGLLPHGEYRFGGMPLKVERVQAVRMDLRNMEIPVEKKRRKRDRQDG